MSELRLLKFQTCANSTTDQWKIYPVYQIALVHPSPLIAMKQQKKKEKKNKKQKKNNRSSNVHNNEINTKRTKGRVFSWGRTDLLKVISFSYFP